MIVSLFTAMTMSGGSAVENAVQTVEKVKIMNTASLALFIAAGVVFLIAAVLFFLLDIPKVFGDVTGYTAKKAIQNIREQNETTGDKAYKPSPVNAARGKVTDKISTAGLVDIKPEENTYGVAVGTSKLKGKAARQYEQQAREAMMAEQEGTTVLSNDNTTYAAEEGTTVLSPDNTPFAAAEGTTVFDPGMMPQADSGATTVLSQNMSPYAVASGPVAPTQSPFSVDYELCFTGSSEIIE